MSSPRLVEGSTFAGADEGDHDDGESSPPEPLVLSELSVSPAAVESSVVGWVRKLASVVKSAQVCSGGSNLSKKNRLRDRFSGSKSRQATGQRFSGPNF